MSTTYSRKTCILRWHLCVLGANSKSFEENLFFSISDTNAVLHFHSHFHFQKKKRPNITLFHNSGIFIKLPYRAKMPKVGMYDSDIS